MGRIASFFRLVRAARVFARHEVLLPPELREMAPFPARFAAGFLKLTTFSRTSKGLSTGQRFAAALGDRRCELIKQPSNLDDIAVATTHFASS